MKNLIRSFATVVLLLTMTSSFGNEVAEPNTSMRSGKAVNSAEVNTLVARINEIKAMDRSSMSPAEKKVLRKEVRSINKNLHEHGHGGVIYVSGGVVLFVLLLIILL
jgi:hypothetical protein